MPTWAAVIIFTSLAPSPIAKVQQLGFWVLTKVTTSYFCLGETLQHSTTLHISPIYITLLDMSGFRACNKESPDIISAY